MLTKQPGVKTFAVSVFLICYLLSGNSVAAQGILGKIKKTTQDLTQIAYQTAAFTQLAGMSVATFNSTIKVFKDDGSAPTRNTVPADKISKFEIKKGSPKNLDWESVAYFDNQLFPSVIISMANYQGPVTGSFMSSIKSSALGFRFKSSKSYVPIKFEIECVEKKFFDKHSGEFIYPNAGEQVVYMPQIPWNYEALAKQTTSAPVNFYFRLIDDEGNKVEKLMSLTMRSINDCLRFYNGQDTRFMYAAYVNEEHPEIDKILREALNTKMVTSWSGYQSGSEAEVSAQVASIWRALHNRGFAYSDITTTTGDEGNVRSQSVRTFDNAIKTSQANCVDGTVVFASILRKIGLYPVMVLRPGHCFLGYYTDKAKTKLEFLETTLVSDDYFIAKAKTEKEKTDAFKKTFNAAVAEATKDYNNNNAKNQITMVIDIAEERAKVKPIPYYQ